MTTTSGLVCREWSGALRVPLLVARASTLLFFDRARRSSITSTHITSTAIPLPRATAKVGKLSFVELCGRAGFSGSGGGDGGNGGDDGGGGHGALMLGEPRSWR